MLKEDRSSLSRRSFIQTASTAALGAAAINGTAFAAAEKERVCGWFKNTRRMLHLDSHFAGFKNVFTDFNAESAARMYADAGFQMVSYFAKCWGGYSYYPTKIGIVHPTLGHDYTGEMTGALKKRGIRRIIYFMMATERELQKKHPEWVVKSDMNADPNGLTTQETVVMCYNSPYTEEVSLPQMKEVLEMYDVDGFFVDIVMQQYLHGVCYCKSCRDLYATEMGGEIPTSDKDPRAFEYRKWSNRHMEAHMEKVYNYLAKVKPDIAIINNYAWMSTYPVTPPFYVPHVTWDTATPAVGNYSWNFSFESRYLNTLPGVPFSCMNTRGNNWGDYALREPEAFQHECAILLAACGGNYLSDIPYPSGNPDQPVYDTFGAVNRRYKALEPILEGSVPVREAAILHSADSVWSKSPLVPKSKWTFTPDYYSVTGVHKALIELHVQNCILNSQVCCDTLKDYRVLIVSDQRILSGNETTKIRQFVQNGGALIVTHESGTSDMKNGKLADFALADMLGVKYLGSPEVANCYLRAIPEMKKFGLPMMDIEAGGSYTQIAVTSAKKLLDLVPPYKGTKGGPPDESPEGAGVTINTYGKGKVLYCAADLFGGYFDKDTPNMRKLAAWMLEQVYPTSSRRIVLENTPVNVEMFYNRKSDREYFIHLVNYSGDKRDTGTPQVQDFNMVRGITVKIRLEKKPSEVSIVPEGRKIDFTHSGGLLVFKAQPLQIHDVYRIVL
jgi:hypothetical protein